MIVLNVAASNCRIDLSVLDVIISRLRDDKGEGSGIRGERRGARVGVHVPSRGKKTQAQMRKHPIRNSSSLVRKLSQPTKIILGGVRLSVAEN